MTAPAPEPPPSRRGPLLTLLVVIVLLAATLWIQQKLRATGTLEDCLMAGRRNCAPVAAPQP